ncbi:protein BCCIP homolog [Phragmites australis]|uniref:protein BCCIP homolog n=1 Tax=Phragmites australis TaxID=29695 RepID=UPI002D78CCCF|nr:protein BCCIP homolog [Phragmites australis]
MPGGRKRPAPFAGFSPFARSLIFSVASSSGSSKPLPLPEASSSSSAAAENPRDNMPRPPSKRAKKQAEPSSDEERSSSESEEESFSSSEREDSSEELETVQADFAFFDPKPSDFHGVKLLLKTYLDSKPWDLTGFVDLILAQTTVGTVVKLADEEEGEGNGGEKTNTTSGDDDDLFGLISVLNLGRYGELRCIKDLKEYLFAVCGDKDTKKKLKSLLEEKVSSVGLLVCRRFVNFPYELVPKLYDSLFDEVSWATEDEPTQELRDSFRFNQYLLVVRILERKTPAKHKANNSKDEDEPVIYLKLEDEIFRELSSWSFTFPICSEQSAQQEMKNYKEMGLVMAINAEAVPKFRKKLEALVSE